MANNTGTSRPSVTWDMDLDETRDDAGHVFKILLTDAGYRLTCDNLPSHSLVKLVFALAVVNPARKVRQHTEGRNGNNVLEAEEIVGTQSQFDLFAQRPLTQRVYIDAKYSRRFRPFENEGYVDISTRN